MDHPRPGRSRPLFIQFFRAPEKSEAQRSHRGDVIRCEYRSCTFNFRLLDKRNDKKSSREKDTPTHVERGGGGGGGGESIRGIDRLILEINGRRGMDRNGMESVG